MKLTSRFPFLILAVLLTSVSCGKDKTLDDWRRERVNEEMAKIQAVQGTYNGEVKTSIPGEGKVAATVEFEAYLQVGQGNGSLYSEQHAAVRGNVTLYGHTKGILPFFNGAYDAESGTLTIDTTVLLTNSFNSQVNMDVEVAGQIVGNKLNARIKTSGYPDTWIDIATQKDSPLSLSQQPNGNGAKTYKYKGTSSAFRQPVTLELIQSLKTDEQFLYYLMPVRMLDATLTYVDPDPAKIIPIFFPTSQWDMRTSEINGKGSASNVSGQTGTPVLNCTGAPEGGWDCRYRMPPFEDHFTFTPVAEVIPGAKAAKQPAQNPKKVKK